jgi:hypothetical protein
MEYNDEEENDDNYPMCRWISCCKNTGYHATDPKDSNAGG